MSIDLALSDLILDFLRTLMCSIQFFTQQQIYSCCVQVFNGYQQVKRCRRAIVYKFQMEQKCFDLRTETLKILEFCYDKLFVAFISIFFLNYIFLFSFLRF